jgi:hypothetical protein
MPITPTDVVMGDAWFHERIREERENQLPATPPRTEPATPASPASGPLSVAEAAARWRVSAKTIRRRLPALEKTGGARKVGTVWRIEREALDAMFAPEARQPKRSPRRGQRKAAAVVDSSISWGD